MRHRSQSRLGISWHGKLKPHQKFLKRLSQESCSMQNLSQEHPHPGIKCKSLEQESVLVQIQHLNISQNISGSTKGQVMTPAAPPRSQADSVSRAILNCSLAGVVDHSHVWSLLNRTFMVIPVPFCDCHFLLTPQTCVPGGWCAATFYLLRKRIYN